MVQITAARALTAHIANRIIRLATMIATCIVLVVLITCGLLAYHFTAWWWLLVVPFLALFVVFLVVRVVLLVIVRRIHAERPTTDQKKAMDRFSEKIVQLIEARGTPPIFFVLVSIKDLLVHCDLTTIKKLITDTASLRHDYQQLERLF